MSKIILSPHFDDAILSAWTAISPEDTCIITICGGVPDKNIKVSSSDKKCGFKTAYEAAIERKNEDREVCSILNISYHHMDEFDYPYNNKKDEERIEEGLRGYINNGDEVYAPIGIGNHPDHIMTRNVIISLYQKIQFNLYLYADYPYAAEEKALSDDYDWNKAILSAAAQGIKMYEVKTRFIAQDDLLEKIEVLKQYKSQIDILRGHYSKLLDCPGILEKESIWRVEL